jgi:hypothetical protein
MRWKTSNAKKKDNDVDIGTHIKSRQEQETLAFG